MNKKANNTGPPTTIIQKVV